MGAHCGSSCTWRRYASAGLAPCCATTARPPPTTPATPTASPRWAPIVGFLAATATAGPVPELGIGTGRLALPRAERGLEVHGVDSSEAMVARLRAKPGGDRCRVVIGDFADVDSLVAGEYPLVFVAFSTLFELESQDDQVRCFAGVAP